MYKSNNLIINICVLCLNINNSIQVIQENKMIHLLITP